MNNTTYSNNQQNWKVPETEVMGKTFNEGARFFAIKKQHGLKYVCPPKAENLQQLIDDKLQAEQQRSPNLLLNGRYAKLRNNGQRAQSQIGGDRVIEDTKSIISQMSRAQTSQGPRVGDTERLQKLNLANLPSEKKKLTYAEQQAKAMKQYNGEFFFPRRKRFNEDVEHEILSQRSGSSQVHKFTPLIKKNIDDKEEQNTLSSHRKNLSEFSKKSKTQMSNYAGPLGKTSYKQKMYMKRLTDTNENPRYAASKNGSIVGGLICGMNINNN